MHHVSSQRRDSNRTCNDGSPPRSDDVSDKDSSDDNRWRQNQRSGRLRRRHDPSPDCGGRSDDGDSSEDDNRTRDSRRFCIKLQKFDGTGSWESWCAHFENCAFYNKLAERDQLAFMKGALSGNAAQVLWDTDRASTGSLKNLVYILNNRFSGE